MNQTTAIIAGATLFLTGCGQDVGKFPSLAKRPFESQTQAVELVTPPPPPAVTSLPSDVAAKVDGVMAKHARAQGAYAKQLPSVQNLAKKAAGAPVGSEGWVNAQMQLSRLDKARGDSVAALSEMETIIEQQSDLETANDTPSLLPLLAPYKEKLSEAVAAQTREVDRLSKLIGE